jgi:hypothetical protein
VTIVLGLVSKHGGIVMSDGRRMAAWHPGEVARIESNEAKKAFRCGSAPFIFGVSGQLAPSGPELSEAIVDALDAAGTWASCMPSR